MASIKAHPESGQYHLRFRFDGQAYRRSLRTGNRREAEAVLARAEETMLLIRRGRIGCNLCEAVKAGCFEELHFREFFNLIPNWY